MKLYFISLCFAFVACITAKAQSKLIFKDKFMYADAQVFNESKKHSIPSMIDTGCSLCIIDSTFAVDSCEIKIDKLQTISVNQTKDKISSTFIDSIFFCGKHITRCIALSQTLQGFIKNMRPNSSSGLISLNQALGDLIWKEILSNHMIPTIKQKGLFINGKSFRLSGRGNRLYHFR